MKHATKSRDLLYNNGIYRNPLQRYRAILTMVTRATLARSPTVGCQTANCSAWTGGVWEVVSNTELSKLWYIYTEASFISCLLINTCILYLITIHNMESVLIFYIVSGSSLWFIYWYWYHNGEYFYFPPSLLIRELIKDFWTILGYLPRGKWVTNKLSHWRRVANHIHICINIRSKRSHHWYW